MGQTVCSPWCKKGPQHYRAQKDPAPGLWGQGKPVPGMDMWPKADPRPHSSEPCCSAGLAFRDTFWEQSYLLGRKPPRNRIHFTIIHFTQDYIAEICFTARCVETDLGKL